MNDKHSISSLPPEGQRHTGIEAAVPVAGVAEVLGPDGLEELRIVGVRLAVVMTTAAMVDNLLCRPRARRSATTPTSTANSSGWYS